MTFTLEEQLRTYGDEIERLATPAAGAEPSAVVDLAEVRDRRRRRMPLLVVSAAAALVLVIGAVLVVNRGGGEVSVVDTGPTETAAPAPSTTVDPNRPSREPDAPISLWLSATRVPPGPIEVVAVLVDHAGTAPTYGVAAAVERWSGTTWEVVGGMSMCLDHWFCTATVQPGNGMVGVPDIGLEAGPGRPGGAERFTLDGLEPGWYRISQSTNDGILATGVIEVAEDAPVPAPLAPVQGPALSLLSVFPPEGGSTTVLPLLEGVYGADIETIDAELSADVTIERWEDGSWTTVEAADLGAAEVQGLRTLEVPPLPAGDYRIVRTGPTRDWIGRFWVADLGRRQPIASGSPSTTIAATDGSVDPPLPTTSVSPPAPPVTTDATTVVPNGPVLRIDPAGPYRDRQDVTVSGAGFAPGRLDGGIGQCPAGVDTARDERCGRWDVLNPIVVADDGTFTKVFRLHASTPFGVDCRVASACVLAWVPNHQSMEAAIPLEFEP